MRHQKGFNKLGRKVGHRKAMLANMACSLIEHKRINTTVAKAKALRSYVEPLITKSKTDTTHSRRMVFRYLRNKYAVTELFREIAPKVADRPGGYTRIIKTGFRLGDAAEMCMIELVDFNDIYTKETKKKTRRRRRGGGKKKEEAAETTPAVEQKAETATEEPKAEEAKAEAPAEETKAEEPKAEAKEEVKDEKAADDKEADSNEEKKKED